MRKPVPPVRLGHDQPRLILQLLEDPTSAARIPVEAIPELLADLEYFRAALWARLATPQVNGSRPGTPSEDRLLDASEAATLLSVPRGFLYDLARRDEIPSVRVGPKYVRFRLSDLWAWVAARREGLDNPPPTGKPKRER